ncbi:dimethylargininase [Leifsonia sp. 98AMF]|uniref:dimethylargininase n=1 Tax=unclassified Leifsonia TaxID=2663824 RepID=UPI00087A48E6|nr:MULTISPECIES: dimethylargininase [unclassified Leifsonia]SDH55685.1 dimethylargininase [Leifsonia sp. 197AMF]SDI83137.1 dimethylargininase [Leifsonia sp. 466MF]SDK00699.1 dimethylargininase [Leifsonia sp. 157MF]SDN86316.1 dimethylargininase [Leifsonia sp. 509MF]SEN20545.1 dimethylargininase [Leifsonia sp. 467MF]
MTSSWGRRLIASLVAALVVVLVVHAAMIAAFYVGSLAGSSTPSGALIVAVSNYFSLTSVIAFVLLWVAGFVGAFDRWWTALIAGVLAAVLAPAVGTILTATSGGSPFSGDLIVAVLGTLLGINLLYAVAITALTPTFGRWLFRVVEGTRSRFETDRKVALVRIPAGNLAEGLVTHIDREPVDAERADAQWDAYVAALSEAGWQTVEVTSADTLADSVFVEDTAVVFGDTAVITLPGAESRRAEVVGTEAALRAQGLHLERIEAPGTLDGGDVLKVGSTVYVGRGGRTNAEGIRQLRALVAPLGYTVVAVPITKALHLKTAVTALPDGTVIGYEPIVDEPRVFERFLPVPEAHGTAVVVLSDDTVLMSSSAPQSVALVEDLGYTVIQVDISEFEKLEGCVTCLSIRIR